MFRRAAAFAAMGLLLSGQAALAAEGARLGGVSGTVMVSQNGRITPAAAGSVLRSGDRVIAANGSARLVYNDGCSVAISARTMGTVSAVSPCAGGSSNVVKVSTVATTASDDDREGRRGYGWSNDRDFWLWLTYGAITVGVTAAALDDDEQPVSP